MRKKDIKKLQNKRKILVNTYNRLLNSHSNQHESVKIAQVKINEIDSKLKNKIL